MTKHSRISALLLLSLLAAALAAAGLVGCSKPPSHAADAGVEPDAAAADAGPDAGPLRALGHRSLFAAAPVENRMVDPTFTLIDGITWNPLNPMSYDVARVTRQHQRTPLGLPALRLEPAAGDGEGQVVGLGKSTAGPVVVSVWLGREGGFDPSQSDVVLLGMFTDGSGALDVGGDPQVPPTEIDGVHWLRFTARVEAGPVGWVYLRLVNRSTDPLFVSAPVLSHDVASRKRGRTGPSFGRRRPLLPIERATLRDWMRRMGDRFGGPPRPLVR